MQYAVIQTGGKQYKVTNGLVLEVEKIADAASSVVFDKVLLHAQDGKEIEVGTPYVSGLTVHAKVLGEVKGDKVRVLRFLAKSRHRRVYGHRHTFTKIQIESIGKKTAEPSSKKEEKVAAPKKTAAAKKSIQA